LYIDDRIFEVFAKGKTKRTRIAANKAKTPSSLFGIERKIA
jgi:hypothetical protein